jgi:hypothetical protein
MKTFKIKDQDRNTPFENTHYWKWLEKRGAQDIHSVSTKIEYLTEQGFVVGTDKLSDWDLFTLKAIEQGYFNKILKRNFA